MRKEAAPFKPEVKDIQDTSNHLQKNKVYEENEIINPFFSKNHDNSDVVIKKKKKKKKKKFFFVKRSKKQKAFWG